VGAWQRYKCEWVFVSGFPTPGDRQCVIAWFVGCTRMRSPLVALRRFVRRFKSTSVAAAAARNT
jgi:hypothetical protein